MRKFIRNHMGLMFIETPYIYMCVCVCVREREREGGGRERVREKSIESVCVCSATPSLDHVVGRCPGGVMVKALDCGIVVSEFVLQSRYYVHFQDKYSWEKYEPPYSPRYGLNSTTTVLLGEYLRQGGYVIKQRNQTIDHDVPQYQLPPISQTFKLRRTIYARHNWRSKDERLSDVLL